MFTTPRATFFTIWGIGFVDGAIVAYLVSWWLR